jgi:hypothetical protein
LAQLGIIYLPQFFVRNLKTIDLLEKAQVKLKIVHIISKQLSKHSLQENVHPSLAFAPKMTKLFSKAQAMSTFEVWVSTCHVCEKCRPTGIF